MMMRRKWGMVSVVLSVSYIGLMWWSKVWMDGIRYEIRVVNGLSSNSSLPLVIWCEGDIGGRALQEGEDYRWDARVSIWRATGAYKWCTMKWDRTRKKFVASQVHRCGSLRKCSWLVKEDGFYFSNDDNHWVKDFSWP